MEWFEDNAFWRDLYPYIFSPERFSAARDEVTQIIALTQCSRGRMLDLCCGPGRHAVEFAQRNFEVTGVDTSPFLLDRARENAKAASVSIEWMMEDARRFTRPAAFDLVCILYNSFGYFPREQDDLQVLRNVYESLKENGVFVMEVVGKEQISRNWQSAICSDFPDGALLVYRPKLQDDFCRIATEWILVKDGRSQRFQVGRTVYSARELKDRLLSCGFREVRVFGDLRASAYDLHAAGLVVVAKK